VDNFIERYRIQTSICNNLIDYFNNNLEYKMQGQFGNGVVNKDVKESIDCFFYNQSTNKHIIEFFEVLSLHVQDYVNKYSIDYPLQTSFQNVIQYYPSNGGYKKIHYECVDQRTVKRKLVYMVYLNDIEKGGTIFPRQNTEIKAEKGSLIIWPADFTHPHKGVVTDVEKYICTGWLEMV
jgi:hypothetical protein